MLNIKNRVINILFITMFFAIILIPLLYTNALKNVSSPLDNRMLIEKPKNIEELRLDGEQYLTDRIGFRDKMLIIYHSFLNNVFNVLEHPLFIYGKDGHTFFGYDSYIKDYQKINIDKDVINRNTGALVQMNNKLKYKNIDFLYVLVPDKKTVYPEFFTSTVNAKQGESLSDIFENELGKTNVNFISLKQCMQSNKKVSSTYNRMFDTGHWNAFGAFEGHRAILNKLKQCYDNNIKVYTENDFNKTTFNVDLIHYLTVHKSETVPKYSLKVKEYIKIDDGTSVLTTVNQNASSDKTILIFGDSYFISCDCYSPFNTCEEFYSSIFKKVVYLKNIQGADMDSFIEKYNPNIVLYETAERVIALNGVFNWDFN